MNTEYTKKEKEESMLKTAVNKVTKLYEKNNSILKDVLKKAKIIIHLTKCRY